MEMVIPRKHEKYLGVIFLVIGIAVSIDVGFLTHQFNRQHQTIEKQIDCNNALIMVLQKRSDARVTVDLKTEKAQLALASFFEDLEEQGANINPNDPHVIDVRKAFQEAAEARSNPDLWASYPDCWLQ